MCSGHSPCSCPLGCKVPSPVLQTPCPVLCPPSASASEQPILLPREGRDAAEGPPLGVISMEVGHEGTKSSCALDPARGQGEDAWFSPCWPLVPSPGPHLLVRLGCHGVTLWGRVAPLSASVPTMAYTHIHSSDRGVRAVGGQSFNLRTEREGKGKIPSNCFWKEVKGALSRAVMLGGRGGGEGRGAALLLLCPPLERRISGTCPPPLNVCKDPADTVPGRCPPQLRTPLLPVSSPPPQTLSLCLLSPLSCLELRMRLPWEPEAQ